ncbi:MAG: hypothetical protein QOK37_368 [Thermoanaerobaculia bacterium]|jgi:hypothetical protein|nr:hypothetical protein [Thermoanaerobaculia bacterium]
MRPTAAELIVRVLAARSEIYPYWLLGWNFINAPSDEPVLINNQQFLFAMSDLGFYIHVPAGRQCNGGQNTS